MKTLENLKKGTLIAGFLLMTVFVSNAGEDEKVKVSNHKVVVFIEQLNQIVNVVNELDLKIEKWMLTDNSLTERMTLDNELPIEEWMVNSNYINTTEEEQNIESWMTDENYLSNESSKEEELEIENWMTK